MLSRTYPKLGPTPTLPPLNKYFRSRKQTSHAAAFEAFDIDRLRDLLTLAAGRPPAPTNWGTRVNGGNAFSFTRGVVFEDLGDLCHELVADHDRTDYRRQFAWLDSVRPVGDPDEIARLEQGVIERLRAENIAELDLAPPEIIDWSMVDSFRFHFDRGFERPDLRLQDYLRGLRNRDELESLDVPFLRSRQATALLSGEPALRWPIWRCLTGEIELGGSTYVLDEGEFFAVERDYMDGINQELQQIPGSAVALPAANGGMREGEYNELAARPDDRLLLDKQLVRTRESTTPIEVCDILTADRQLIHVKRHLGSSDLSHLFSQGAVSAELLQMNPAFRDEVGRKIAELDNTGRFRFIDPRQLNPDQFEVVYAIIHGWRGRSLTEALPFFSKVNLRRTARELRSRGYQVSHLCIDGA